MNQQRAQFLEHAQHRNIPAHSFSVAVGSLGILSAIPILYTYGLAPLFRNYYHYYPSGSVDFYLGWAGVTLGPFLAIIFLGLMVPAWDFAQSAVLKSFLILACLSAMSALLSVILVSIFGAWVYVVPSMLLGVVAAALIWLVCRNGKKTKVEKT
jgi:hypothetical protein